MGYVSKPGAAHCTDIQYFLLRPRWPGRAEAPSGHRSQHRCSYHLLSEAHLVEEVLQHLSSKQRPRENRHQRQKVEFMATFVTKRTFLCSIPILMFDRENKVKAELYDEVRHDSACSTRLRCRGKLYAQADKGGTTEDFQRLDAAYRQAFEQSSQH